MADLGGAQGARAPPFGKEKKLKKGPLTENEVLRPRKRKNLRYYPPPPPNRIAWAFGDHGKFLLLPPPPLNRIGFSRSRKRDHGKILLLLPPPPPLNRIGFSRSRKRDDGKILLLPPLTESHRLLEITEKFCYYPPPPPLNCADMALHTKAGPLLRKILDPRLNCTSWYHYTISN